MKAAFLEKAGSVCIKDIPVPDCADHEVLVQVKEVGVCGSDLHYFREGRIGQNVIREPHILGHECSGVIAAAGKNVRGLVPGDRVVVEPGLPCLSCPFCLEGKYNLCTSVRFLGAPPNPGTFRQYLAHDARFVYKLPDVVTLTEGALIEPLAVAYNAIERADIRPGATLLIIGSGPIGMACSELARVFGAATIIVSEPDVFRAAVAKQMGADLVLNPLQDDLVAAIHEHTCGRMCDAVIEASGVDRAIVDAVMALRKGGTVAVVAMGREEVPLPAMMFVRKEASIRAVYRYANHFQPVLALLAAGRINTDKWISHRFDLEELQGAMELANDPGVDKLKIIIRM